MAVRVNSLPRAACKQTTYLSVIRLPLVGNPAWTGETRRKYGRKTDYQCLIKNAGG
ncbi:MAG TPA: hypothetical protein VJG32_17805 [Anaerolineae bacterium]|nr:hypothetical protein [Anaerolineae bacterium]